MTIPNFLIIGAAKAGTTSLYSYLEQHPDIYMSPIKEPRFFAPEFYTSNRKGFTRGSKHSKPMTIDSYLELFEDVGYEKAVGEASTEYLYFAEVPKRIQQYNPSMKMIVLLRNPIERAYSAYCYQLRDGCETLSFEAALEQEENRKKSGWRPGWLYTESSLYYTQLKRYYDVFDTSQIRVYFAEELRHNASQVVKDVCNYLEVDSEFTFEKSKKNVSYTPRNTFMNRLIKRNKIINGATKIAIPKRIRESLSQKFFREKRKSELSAETRKKLAFYFQRDVLNLGELLNRNLSHWLSE